MNQQPLERVEAQNVGTGFRQKFSDLLILVKFKLTFFVVFSATFAYLIVSNGNVNWLVFGLLIVGGYLVGGAANALNQILEREYDRKMKRTENRPLAAHRMNVSEALVIAGFMCLFGIICLSVIHPLCGLLGMLSLITYSFIYTPMKRFNTLSVAVGAIPGALPVLIGAAAFDGRITAFALLLFAIQFLWQFPHFWAIGWLSFDQYRNAGFELLPHQNEKIDPSLGWVTLLYSLLLVGLVGAAWAFGFFTAFSGLAVLLMSLWYAWKSYGFYRQFDRTSARKLMFSSFVYLPVVLIILFIASI